MVPVLPQSHPSLLTHPVSPICPDTVTRPPTRESGMERTMQAWTFGEKGALHPPTPTLLPFPSPVLSDPLYRLRKPNKLTRSWEIERQQCHPPPSQAQHLPYLLDSSYDKICIHFPIHFHLKYYISFI